VKAQLIAALSRTAPPKVVPFWRRPGLMGAAAGLIVAATAGLAYLRSPEKAPPQLQESAKPRQAEAAAVPAAPQATQARAKQKVPAVPPKETAQPFHMVEAPAPPPQAPAPEPLMAPSMAGALVPAHEDAARMNVQAAAHQAAEARQQEAKKAEASKSAASMMDSVGSAAPSAKMKAKTVRQEGTVHPIAPTWTLEVRPDGSTGVTIVAARGHQVVILRRGTAGVEALSLRAMKAGEEALVLWQGDVRLAAGDVLDLYLLNAPVAEPRLLPETGPVDGYRVRIHPAAKK
jgi:hypothetical protein